MLEDDPRLVRLVEKPTYKLISAASLTLEPIKQDWLLSGIIERGSLNILWGEPCSGKTLFALDWAFCIASGLIWHEKKTKKNDVVIIAGEGFAGIARRLKALEIKYSCHSPENLYISERPAQLIESVNAAWVAESVNRHCENPSLVIIDTLHRNMGGNEDSSEDFGKFINNLDTHFKPLGVAVLLVHHSGHGDKNRSRGSSSIRAAMDGEFAVVKSEDGIILSCHKAKDFDAFHPMRFSLEKVDLDWEDDEGDLMTSVYVEYAGQAGTETKMSRLNVRDEAVFSSLFDALNEFGEIPADDIYKKFGGFDHGKRVVHIEDWRAFAYKAIVIDGNDEGAKRKAFKRCRDKLLKIGKTMEYNNFVWCL